MESWEEELFQREEGPGFLGGGCREGPFGFIQKTGPGVGREVPRPGDNGSSDRCSLRDIPLPMEGGRRKPDSPMIDPGYLIVKGSRLPERPMLIHDSG